MRGLGSDPRNTFGTEGTPRRVAAILSTPESRRQSVGRAIVLRQPGGPDVLKAEPISVGAPASGQVRIRQTAIGVNFHDCYVRSGLYKTLTLPGVPGLEAVGVVEAVGPDVKEFRPGDRVGYMLREYGSYATVHRSPMLAWNRAGRLAPCF